MADPVTVENTVKKAGQVVVQAGTIIGDIHPPSNRRAGVGLLAGILGCAVVALVGAVVLQALPDTIADNAPAPAPVVTNTVVAPTSTSAPPTSTAVTPKDAAAAPATVTVTHTSTAPARAGAAPVTTPVTPAPSSTSSTTVAPTTTTTTSTGGYLPY